MAENTENVEGLLEEYFNGAKKDSVSLRDGVLASYPLSELAKDMAVQLKSAMQDGNAKVLNALMPYVFAKKATPIQPIQTENIANLIAFLSKRMVGDQQKTLPDGGEVVAYHVVTPGTAYRPVYEDVNGLFAGATNES